MSENKSQNKPAKGYLALHAGVVKIDHFAAGFPDLEKIAQEWAKDENFKEIIVRGVSETNYGIQFVYVSKNPEQTFKKYLNELEEKFGKDFYARDIHNSYTSSEDEKQRERVTRLIIKSEKIELD